MTALTSADSSRDTWPVKDLESVPSCPACGVDQRTLLHSDLRDGTFFNAPGLWTMWKCRACGTGYLDPRPTPDSIGRAYDRYYTHANVEAAPSALTRAQRLRVMLANGYRNAVYGTRSVPAAKVGALIARLLPRVALATDLRYRYLSGVADVADKRLLDVGCGAGQFLVDAQAAGWEAHGVDFDPVAAAGARARGLDVRTGGVEVWADQPDSFDAVTLSHVIEHVYDPRETVETILRILKPGGKLYIETPNLDALGHLRYGAHWRGLEAPRHLVLFTGKGLRRLLRSAGYRRVRAKPVARNFIHMAQLSAKMAEGKDPYDASLTAPAPGRLDRVRGLLTWHRTEFIIYVGEKPSSQPRTGSETSAESSAVWPAGPRH